MRACACMLACVRVLARMWRLYVLWFVPMVDTLFGVLFHVVCLFCMRARVNLGLCG